MRTYLTGTPMRYVWMTLSLAAILTVVLVACGGTTTATPTPTVAAPTAAPTATPTPLPATMPLGATIVTMIEKHPGGYFFAPSAITIKVGSVVVWVNRSDGKHTITSNPGAPSAFDTTSNITQGQTFALVFMMPGVYHYHCKIHPVTMQATITVTP